MIGDEQRANCTQDIPTVLDQEIPQVIGDEQHAKLCTRPSNGIGARIPQTIRDEPHKNSAHNFPTVLGQETPSNKTMNSA